MSVAPPSRSSGMSTLISDFATTVSTAKPAPLNNSFTVGDFIDDVSEMGWSAAVADRKMWAEMKMSPTDLADVSGYTYTYLMNGQAPNGNWTGIFKPGEKIRLRFINASAMTYFDVRIPGLKMTVVAADGLHGGDFGHELLVEGERLKGISGVYASPVSAGGRVYIAGRNGTVSVLKDSAKLEVLATNELDDKFDCSPAVVGNQMFLRGKEHLYCIATK